MGRLVSMCSRCAEGPRTRNALRRYQIGDAVQRGEALHAGRQVTEQYLDVLLFCGALPLEQHTEGGRIDLGHPERSNRCLPFNVLFAFFGNGAALASSPHR